MGKCYLIIAEDEFIAENAAKSLYEELSKNIQEDFSKEILSGSAGTVDEAVKICKQVRDSIMTVSMFEPEKLIWLRNVNFFTDSRAGKSATTTEAIENLVENIKTLPDSSVNLIISTAAIDKRKKIIKELVKLSEVEDLKAKDPSEACAKLIKLEAKKLGVEISTGALHTLMNLVAFSPRMAISDLTRLATYMNFEGEITEKIVVENVPVFGEGDFFDISNAFFGGDLEVSNDALTRYFFTNKTASARPIISSLQNKTSLLIQIKALLNSGKLPMNYRGASSDAFVALGNKYEEFFRDCAKKSNYNVFSQNSWFVCSMLAPIANKFTLKRLIDFQMNYIWAFKALMDTSNSDESVMRELFVKCAVK